MSSLFLNAYYIGINFTAILYGGELITYGVTMNALWAKSRRGRSDVFFMVFSTLLLVLMTIMYATNAIFGEEMYVVNTDYPGGMQAYLAENVNVWYQTLGSAAPVTANLMGDGLMIFRCYIIYNSAIAIVIPSIVWLGTLASGILLLYASGSPDGDFFAGISRNCGLAYYATTIALNVMTTALIISRLLWVSSYMHKNLGRTTSKTYIDVVVIVVESALPYTLCGIINLITYAIQSDTNVLFVAIYGMMTGLSPQLIIMRVVMGRALTRGQVADATTESMIFASGTHEVTMPQYGGQSSTAGDTATSDTNF